MNTEYPTSKGLEFDLEPVNRNVKQASSILKAMSNHYRLLILCQLAGGEKRVGELEKIIGLSQSALSQHLARLRRDELVVARREAQSKIYALASSEVHDILVTLSQLYADKDLEAPRLADGRMSY